MFCRGSQILPRLAPFHNMSIKGIHPPRLPHAPYFSHRHLLLTTLLQITKLLIQTPSLPVPRLLSNNVLRTSPRRSNHNAERRQILARNAPRPRPPPLSLPLFLLILPFHHHLTISSIPSNLSLPPPTPLQPPKTPLTPHESKRLTVSPRTTGPRPPPRHGRQSPQKRTRHHQVPHQQERRRAGHCHDRDVRCPA